MAALLIRTSIWGIEGSLRIVFAAFLTEEKEERSTRMYLIVIDGSIA